MPSFNLVWGKQCVYSRKAVPLNDRVAQEDTVMNIIGGKPHDSGGKEYLAGSNLELLCLRNKMPTPETPLSKASQS